MCFLQFTLTHSGGHSISSTQGARPRILLMRRTGGRHGNWRAGALQLGQETSERHSPPLSTTRPPLKGRAQASWGRPEQPRERQAGVARGRCVACPSHGLVSLDILGSQYTDPYHAPHRSPSLLPPIPRAGLYHAATGAPGHCQAQGRLRETLVHRRVGDVQFR